MRKSGLFSMLVAFGLLVLSACAPSVLPVPAVAPELPADIDISLVPGPGITKGTGDYESSFGSWSVKADVGDKGAEHFYMDVVLTGPNAQSYAYRLSDIECTEISGNLYTLKIVSLIPLEWEILPCSVQ